MIDTTQVKSDDEKREIAKLIATRHMSEKATKSIDNEYEVFMEAYYYVLKRLQE